MKETIFKLVSFCLLGLIMAGCSTPSSTFTVHTLDGNPALPGNSILSYHEPGKREELRNKPYEAYFVYRASISKDRELDSVQLREAYPDESLEHLGRPLVDNVRLNPVNTATRIDPKAEVYVVFYRTSPDSAQAIVYAEQSDTLGVENVNLDEFMEKSRVSSGLEFYAVYTFNAPEP